MLFFGEGTVWLMAAPIRPSELMDISSLRDMDSCFLLITLLLYGLLGREEPSVRIFV